MKKTGALLLGVALTLGANTFTNWDEKQSLYEKYMTNASSKKEYLKNLNTQLKTENLNCEKISNGYSLIGEMNASQFLSDFSNKKISKFELDTFTCKVDVELNFVNDETIIDNEKWNDNVSTGSYVYILTTLQFLEKIGSFDMKADALKYFFKKSELM